MKVAGFCPMGCGETLVTRTSPPDQVAHVVCGRSGCPNPEAVDAVLADRETEHVVVFTETGWDAQHPLRERPDGDLFDCAVHRALSRLKAPPLSPGRYRVMLRGHELVYRMLGSSS